MATLPVLAVALALVTTSPDFSVDADVEDTLAGLGVEETVFEVRPKKALMTPLVGEVAPLPPPSHAARGLAYIDPFVGRDIYPELSVGVRTGLLSEKTANEGEVGGTEGRLRLGGRLDLSLYLLDIRIPIQDRDAPVELIFKAPFGVGRHRFAPMLIAHVPTRRSLANGILEAALGYHYERDGLGFKLELSAFNGAPDRTRSPNGSAFLGFDVVLSYLASPAIAVAIEANGVTAVSEQRDSVPPALGDTVLQIAPGLRIFPDGPSFQIGIAALFNVTPDGYRGLLRQQGALVDLSYVFH